MVMKIILTLIIAISVLFIGCTVTTTTPKLQNAEQFGAVNNNTIKITNHESAGDFSVRLNVTKNLDRILSTKIEGHTMVNKNGIYEVKPIEGEDYFIETAGVNTEEFSGNNLHWNIPEFQTNFEVEVNVTPNFSLYGGTTFADIDQIDLNNFNFGLGFFREENNWAVRLDIAGAYYETETHIDYVRVEDKPFTGDAERRVFFFNESRKENFFDLNLGVTINSKNPEWFINGFINYTFGQQSFFDIEPTSVTFYDWLKSSEGKRFELDETYHTLSLGLYKEIESLGYLFGGVRFNKYTDSEDKLFAPNYFLQFDFQLF
ncbi:hypothetical protein ASZ90_005162 [hydrocarbon metagenome]|uniref:Lipoprotein n=1 Tax=hydrocarbon metagenome TaxID=938273 RepID=A0A0W8FVW8_9ZZZZ